MNEAYAYLYWREKYSKVFIRVNIVFTYLYVYVNHLIYLNKRIKWNFYVYVVFAQHVNSTQLSGIVYTNWEILESIYK